MRIAYVFTTFPKLSERFFLREVQELRRQGVDLDVFSMIGGVDLTEAGPVRHFGALDVLQCAIEFIRWFVTNPCVSVGLFFRLNPIRYRSLTNWGENAIGLMFAFRFARSFQTSYEKIHGTWATAPGMAVFGISRLTGLRYTMEAHAYDIYRSGGDAYLKEKIREAYRIRSSTMSATEEILQRQKAPEAAPSNVFCVRRGLSKVPDYRDPDSAPPEKLRILSVGRLIEKKGYPKQLEVFAELLARGIDFEARIVGRGPLERHLKSEVENLGLSNNVQLVGKLDHMEVDREYSNADLFLFYGRVSASGDRDGFPNVIGEAMSMSLPVFSTDVAGTTEAIAEDETGFLLDGYSPTRDAEKIVGLMKDRERLSLVTRRAHIWVLRNFSLESNVAQLREHLWQD